MKLTHRNDNFLEDYLHRGTTEHVSKDAQTPTPLRDMDHFLYGMFVRVVPGSSWDLKKHQYAFEEHHPKFETHVQELRPSPVVPYLSGYNMPTEAKKPEENACFKQLLFRPYRCLGAGRCGDVGAVAGFCACRTKLQRVRDVNGIPEDDDCGKPLYQKVRTSSFVQPWRHYRAQQFALAARAQEKANATRTYPVLFDVTLLREWWLPGALEGGVVHHRLAPMLEHGLRLPPFLVWHILRFSGYVRGDDEGIIGIANTEAELNAVRALKTSLEDVGNRMSYGLLAMNQTFTPPR